MARAMKVAIVDDEQDMRQSISQWLALSGFDTETFASAEDALKTIGADYPGVVVSDIKMPGMDGMEATRTLRQLALNPQPYIIAFTANAFKEELEKCYAAGVDDHLTKPASMSTLSEALKKATVRVRSEADFER